MIAPNTPPMGLPTPDAAALADSHKLQTLIAESIQHNGGTIGFDQYMETTLYAPQLGYYNSTRDKFGEQGDFITAPELTPLFAYLLANQLQQVLTTLKGGTILEIGAGTASMAGGILDRLNTLERLPERYLILEISDALVQQQKTYLQQNYPKLYERVTWLKQFPRESFRGVIVANEVLDAIPVKRFKYIREAIMEITVGLNQHGGFVWMEKPADGILTEKIQTLNETCTLPDNYISEINLNLNVWIQSLANCLSEGVVLLSDYGYPQKEYYHPERQGGTLICHYRHRAHDDPFVFPSLQDISASVDFTALAGSGLAANIDVLGYTNQTYFLAGNGLGEALAELEMTGRQEIFTLKQAARQLTLPNHMGEKFKFMILGKNFFHPLQGFSIRDQRALL